MVFLICLGKSWKTHPSIFFFFFAWRTEWERLQVDVGAERWVHWLGAWQDCGWAVCERDFRVPAPQHVRTWGREFGWAAWISWERTPGTFSAVAKAQSASPPSMWPRLGVGFRGCRWALMLVHHVLSGRMLVELRPAVSVAARDPPKKRGAGWDKSAWSIWGTKDGTEFSFRRLEETVQKLELEIQIGEFPGSSVVKTCTFTAVDPGLIPGWEIPQAMQNDTHTHKKIQTVLWKIVRFWTCDFEAENLYLLHLYLNVKKCTVPGIQLVPSRS